MLNRSRSWPVQSFVTLDPRGVVRSQVQTPNVSFQKIKERKKINGYNKDAFAIATPDVVLEAKDRIPIPDIFLTLAPKPAEAMQVHFVDHYELLDADCGLQEREFVVRVPTEEKVPLNIPINERGALTGENESRTCELCRYSSPTAKYDLLKRKNDVIENVNVRDDEESATKVDKGFNQLLSSYQIDILRKNCLKSAKERRESSFDLNCSFDKESIDLLGKRKPFERKLTAEFESVASNETKTTDCDEKCISKRSFKREVRTSPAQLIRSYSLGHERTCQRLNGTFKKFSLPTPITQLKEGNGAVESPAEGEANATRGVNLDTRKVTTLTRHYYPEGGWGYVIVTCSVMVHILCHGLQLAYGVIASPAVIKFRIEAVHTGKQKALFTLKCTRK